MTKASPFTELDAAILDVLTDGPKTMGWISQRLRKQSEALAIPDSCGDRCGWRVVDRRLQALRKAGKIKTDRKTGWSIA